MSGTPNGATRTCSAAFGMVCAVLAWPTTVAAQAWVPPPGIGVISVVYQDIDNTGHRLTDGSMLDGYDSISRGVLFNLDYAVTDRFSFAVGLPYLGAKYTGPEPSFFGLPIDDCLCWNRGWQDVSGSVRYNLANGIYALTPSISFGVPSHDYDYFGEAVLGRNLKELRLAIDGGRRLDEISDRLSVSGRLAYAFVEEVADIPNNRTNASLEVTLLATRRLATRFAVAWQHSHGGLKSTELLTNETLLSQYDRLIKDNNVHITGGAAYSLSWFDVFGSYTHYAAGTDTHSGRALTIGISWPFER
jgi:hypothetical protein